MRVHARPCAAGEARPEVFRGDALHDEDEEVGDTDDFQGADGDPDDELVGLGDGDAEELDADTGFQGETSEDIDGFACPPPLQLFNAMFNPKGRMGSLPLTQLVTHLVEGHRHVGLCHDVCPQWRMCNRKRKGPVNR